MKPTSRDEFAEYCLRKLGAPVIQINVDDDQVDDRIDEALEFYTHYHYDAIENIAITYEITQEDIDNGFITIPSDIISITKMVHDGSGFIMGQFGSNLWHSMKSIAYDINFGSGACRQGTSYYTSMMDYLAHIEFTFNVDKRVEFQYRNHHIYFSGDFSKFAVDDILAFQAYRIINPEVYGDIWSDMALINYCVALIGEQWGSILSKYADAQISCGITLDGDKLYDRYHDERIRIEEEFSLKWEEPVDFYVG